MDMRKRAVEKRNFLKQHPETKVSYESELLLNKLSLSLARYLGSVVWEKELNLIFKFETDNPSDVAYFTERPLPPPDALKYMALSVKYLGLLKDELMLDTMACYSLCCEKLMRHMYLSDVREVVSILVSPNPIRSPSLKSILPSQSPILFPHS